MYEKNSSDPYFTTVFWRKEFFFKKTLKTHIRYKEKLIPLSTLKKI